MDHDLNNLLQAAAESLSSYLDRLLPSLFDNWWKDAVLDKLSFQQQRLTTEARGFLVKVRTMGLLSDEAQEEVIDRVMRSTEDPISEHEIKLITILTLLSHSNNLWLREIDCFLENDWKQIYH